MDRPLLFCGIQLNSQLNEWLSHLPIHIKNQLIQGDTGYLHEFHCSNNTYLGKWLVPNTSFQEVEMVEENIHSILKRFNSNYNSIENPIYILPGHPNS